jgi:NAD(P)-dependent dehydrogenase (short-subunit alcohol dehydrogenase family)
MTKKILITGSTKGIGKGIAQKFQENGWQVCITGRNEQEVNYIVSEFNSNRKDSAIGLASDLSQIKEINQVKKFISNQWGHLDSMVFNIGSGSGPRGINSSFSENKELMDVNYINPVKNFNIFLDLLKSENSSSIIFIGSIAQEVNVGAPISYSYSKKALNIFAKSQASNLATRKISVNVINPGHIFTENGRWGQKSNMQGEFENFISKNIPVGRMGQLDDVSNIIYKLLEKSDNDYLTGASLNLDGGTSLLF